jgi:hypothetical protein
MPERKLMIYPKGSSRPIMLTDKDGKESVHELIKSLEGIFESDKVFTISTSDDLLIGKPSEVGFIQVKSQNEFEDFEVRPEYSSENVASDSPELSESLEALDKVISDPALQAVMDNYSEPPPSTDEEQPNTDYDLIITDD